MAGQSSVMIGQSWTDVSVLGSQVFGQALMDSCDTLIKSRIDFLMVSMLTKCDRYTIGG